MTVMLAHGALGPFDEIIFIGIAIVFVVMMGISWMRSQALTDDEEDVEDAATSDSEYFELR